MAFIGDAFDRDNGRTVFAAADGPYEIGLTAHTAVIFSGIDEIGPDIAEQVDAHGRIDRDEQTVFANDVRPVCVTARTHLHAGTHMAEVIEVS